MPHKKSLFLLFAAVAAAAVLVTMGSRGQTRQTRERREEANTPVVDFNAPESANPEEKALRRLRNRSYDYAGDRADAQRFAIKETAEPVILDLPVSDGLKESPLPVRQADAVVLGKITDARAYLSNDKTNVYSEFDTLVEEVLLNDRPASLFTGAVIPTQRRGGTVRFPSGKTVVRGAFGRTMPRVGVRYLLFLKKDEEGQAFSIITGYALLDGKVRPLDGLSQKIPQLAQFAAYENADETAFISQVRDAIAQERGHD